MSADAERRAVRGTTLLSRILPIPNTPASAGRAVVTLLLSAMAVVGLGTAAGNWYLTDLKAYLEAGRLLASGGNPFDVALLERGLPYHYHYSPWFAAVFVPLTALPVELVRIGWSALLVAASGAALIPLARSHGAAAIPLLALLGFLMLNLVAEGNVQPLLLAGLVWTLERRAGPVMIGIAASLKIAPILLALVYVGRGEWRRAGVAALVTATLAAPTLLFGLPETATATGGTGLFTTAPVLWAVLVLAAVAATGLLARTRFGWLAAATATVVALPRLLVFDVTNLLAAVPAAAHLPEPMRPAQQPVGVDQRTSGGPNTAC